MKQYIKITLEEYKALLLAYQDYIRLCDQLYKKEKPKVKKKVYGFRQED